MSRKILVLSLVLAGLAAPALADDNFRSPPVADSLHAGQLAGKRALMLAKTGPGPKPVAVTPEEVGDADSFGNKVKWLGLMAGSIVLTNDCTPAPGDPVNPFCVTLNPAPAFTSFNVPNIASITLPARSSQSLLCHWQTPIVNYFAANNTGSPQMFQLRATPTYRIESEVLSESGLVDPGTGLPYGGVIQSGLTAIVKSRTLANAEVESEFISGARVCIGTMISKSALINNYGLSEDQARRFFRRPITITMGISGQARLVENASLYFGTRFVGD